MLNGVCADNLQIHNWFTIGPWAHSVFKIPGLKHISMGAQEDFDVAPRPGSNPMIVAYFFSFVAFWIYAHAPDTGSS